MNFFIMFYLFIYQQQLKYLKYRFMNNINFQLLTKNQVIQIIKIHTPNQFKIMNQIIILMQIKLIQIYNKIVIFNEIIFYLIKNLNINILNIK